MIMAEKGTYQKEAVSKAVNELLSALDKLRCTVKEHIKGIDPSDLVTIKDVVVSDVDQTFVQLESEREIYKSRVQMSHMPFIL